MQSINMILLLGNLSRLIWNLTRALGIKEKEGKIPHTLGRQHITREKLNVYSEIMGPKITREPGKNHWAFRAKGWVAEERHRELKRKQRGLGLIFGWFILFPICLFATSQILEQLAKYHANIPTVTTHE